jgi:hypothetical protein
MTKTISMDIHKFNEMQKWTTKQIMLTKVKKYAYIHFAPKCNHSVAERKSNKLLTHLQFMTLQE